MGRKRERDITGQRFGKLVALYPEESHEKYKNWRWVCKCDCGNFKSVTTSNLCAGHAKSCGCNRYPKGIRRNYKNGFSRTRIGNIYRLMVSRCSEGGIRTKNYYDRGVRVCEEWLGEDGINNFVKWANENGYSDELTLDRIDVNGNYEPSNCRWATYREQANNTRVNKRITYNGETKTVADWSRELGMNYGTLQSRLRNGWTVEEAFTKPLRIW